MKVYSSFYIKYSCSRPTGVRIYLVERKLFFIQKQKLKKKNKVKILIGEIFLVIINFHEKKKLSRNHGHF